MELEAVTFKGDPCGLPGKIDPADPLAVGAEDVVLRRRQRQPGEDDANAGERLQDRLGEWTDEVGDPDRSRPAGSDRQRPGRALEVVRRQQTQPAHAVADRYGFG
ncbi:MAG TPA: hypothetical protein VME70_09390 [Mycobacteriales bacterium]|nr:hypothetical protein [Mycobacteriales bacterium]